MSDSNINPDPPTGKLLKRQTRAEVEQQLRAEIGLLSLLIRDWVGYIDTIDFLANQPVTDALRKTCRKAEPFPCLDPHYRYRIQVQRPSRATYDYISQAMARHLMTRFDLALDFVTDTQADAKQLRGRVRHMKTQPWRGKQTTKTVGETDYQAWENARRNIVVYADWPYPACHVECRHSTAELCQRRGVRHATDLRNLVDQLDRDPRQVVEWLRRNARLSAIHWNGTSLDPRAFAGLPVQDVLDTVRIPRAAQVHVPFTLLMDGVVDFRSEYGSERIIQ